MRLARGARVLVVVTADAINVRQMIEAARTLNPAIETVIHNHHGDEATLLDKEVSAEAMARKVLSHAASA